jgi:hypothetical protein
LGLGVDLTGQITVAGRFYDRATFGEGEDTVTLEGGTDSGEHTFVARFTPQGDVLWARQILGSVGGFNAARTLAVDLLGDSYVAGWFEGVITLGAGDPTETILIAPPNQERNSFLAKYDPTGTLVWARQADTSRADGTASVAVDVRGNIYLTGIFVQSARFGIGEPRDTTLVQLRGVAPGFVVKLDRFGRLEWARLGGGSAITTDALGNVYVTGSFTPGEPIRGVPPDPITVTFGPGEPHETTLTTAGERDVFVAKIAASPPRP